jgi:ABC-type branched-subunit amino acid transport system substrate-binding protein
MAERIRVPEAGDLAARIRARFTVRANRVGIALPLSGPRSSIGERMRRALDAGRPAQGPELVFEDTGGTPHGAAAAVEALVMEHQVVAIVGPVGDRESLAAAHRATELEVPLIVLADRPDLPSVSPWIFRRRFGLEAQVRSTVRYAADHLGLTRLAILYPTDSFGDRAAEIFWREVAAAGGSVTAAASYPEGADGEALDRAVRLLIGGEHAGARGDAFEVGQGKFKGYRPIVRFQGLFIADYPAVARQLLRHLTYYDVAIRTSPTVPAVRKAVDTGRELVAVQILGTAAWNDPGFARGAPMEVQNAVFCDVFHREAPEPSVASFVRRFHRASGRPPSSVEAQARDAMAWVMQAWRSAARRGREGVRRALLSEHVAMPATGPARIRPDGAAILTPMFLTVSGAGIVRRERLDSVSPNR